MKIIANNKSASFEYFIEDKYEAGIVLEGNEIKSLREGKVNMNDCFCFVRGNTVSVKNMHITLYDKSDAFSTKDTRRDRKGRILLQHKMNFIFDCCQYHCDIKKDVLKAAGNSESCCLRRI